MRSLKENQESANQEEAAAQAVEDLVPKVLPDPALKVATVADPELKEATVVENAVVAEVKEAKTANADHQKMQLLEKPPSQLMAK
jgi:hypothetical protein